MAKTSKSSVSTKTPRQIKICLKQMLAENNVTLRYVSEDIGLTPATLSRISTGKQYPDLKTIAKLCDYFSCELGDLVKLE